MTRRIGAGYCSPMQWPLRRMAALMTIVIALAACSSPSPSGSAAESAAGSAQPSASASAAASLTPTPTGDLPAGVQFAPGSVELPPGFGSVNAELGDRTIFFGRKDNLPAVAEHTGETWTVTSFDQGLTYQPPSGFSQPGGAAISFVPTAASSGSSGVVAIGTTSLANLSLPAARQARQMSLIWSSADGTDWQRFDPRDVLGGAANTVVLLDVRGTPWGFFAVGSVGSAAGAEPTEAIILHSADGLSWSVAARFAAIWSLTARAIHVGTDRIVVAGLEHVCEATAASMYTATKTGAAVRAWQSGDEGSTWEPVDLAGAEPALGPPEPAPANAAGCPVAADSATLDARFAATGSIVGIGDDRLVVVSNDGARTAAEGSGSSWLVTDLPDGVAAAGPDGGAARAAASMLFTASPSGWILRRLEARRDEAGRQRHTGCHVYWWQSTDQGVSWAAGPLTKPVRSCTGGLFDLQERSDSSVIFFLLALPVTPNPISSYRTSVPGPLVFWGMCAPGPAADCAFATLSRPSGSGLDWSGIDLFGADIVDAQLDGANLSAAGLSGARIAGSFVGANMRDVSLFGATLSGDFSGVDFRGGDASRTTFDADLVGANLSGMSLTLVTFHGDLTGANFGGAYFGNVTFLPGTTCPDGDPAGDAAGLAACRLG